jgi:sialate O-acetylesterase
MKLPMVRSALLLVSCWAITVRAEVSLPPHFADHMVLQRETPVPIWGAAAPGESVTVSLEAQQKSTVADSEGKWRVDLDPLAAGGPFTVRVAGKNVVELKDVLVGEVWLASGQSNMDFTVAKTEKYYFAGVANAEDEIAAANHPRLRMFTAEWTRSAEPQREVAGAWKVCTPDNVREFSAVAYFFAREVQRELDVPVGIVTCTYGASTVEAWIRREALANEPQLQPFLQKFDTAHAAYAADPARRTNYERAMARWESDEARAKAEGRRPPRKPKNPDPVQDQHNATVMFNGMIAPVIPYAIRGVIWYQGESSVNEAKLYPLLQNTLIHDWRKLWGRGDFPFYLVQIANINAPKPEPGNSRLAAFRDAQLQSLVLPNTGAAVTIDIGEEKDVHPRNKQEVGKRLALIALAKTYEKPVEYSGPVFASLEVEGDKARIKFTHTTGGLMAKDGPLKQFAIAGTDGNFAWADAIIDGDSVVLHSTQVPAPFAIRYAWADNPAGCNLVNGAGLPAVPFHAETRKDASPD